MDFPLSKKLSQPDPFDFSWVKQHRSEEIRPYYPEGRGFMKKVGGTYRGDPALEDGGYNSPTGGYFAPFSNPFIEQKPDDEWLTDRLTDDAIEFMDQHQDAPFLVNLHYYTVHRPIVARSPELLEKYLSKPGGKMDDAHDAMRSIRSKQFKLILNLMPERAYCRFSHYKEGAFRSPRKRKGRRARSRKSERSSDDVTGPDM